MSLYDEKTSALIPVHNDAYILDLCLASIVGHFDQICLFDDASTDGSRQVCQKWLDLHPDNIDFVYTDKQQGWGQARNTLLDSTKARYLFWLDADEVMCQYNAEVIRDTIKTGAAAVRMAHCEMVGDFHHTTTRLFHGDPNQFYMDRKQVPGFRWAVSGKGFSCRKSQDPYQLKRPIGLFSFHLKGVRPDNRLAERLLLRAWHREMKLGDKSKQSGTLRSLVEEHGGHIPKGEPSSSEIMATMTKDGRHTLANRYLEEAVPTYCHKDMHDTTRWPCLRRKIPDRPEVIMAALPGRFEVVYDHRKVAVDRVDHEEAS